MNRLSPITMKFLRSLSAAVVAAIALPTVLAGSIQPRTFVSSHEQPRDVDWDTNHFTVAAGLTQETYCADSKVGMKIGDDAELLWQTGNGDDIQRALIYHSKTLGITLALEGTNKSSIVSIFNDVEAISVDVDYRWKDSVPKGAQLMFGFQDAYLKVADKVAQKIPEFKKQYNESRLTIVGHSLGASMGLVAAGHLQHVIDGGVHEIILFGLPRTGNKIYADWFDETFGDRFHFIVNGKDWVPHMAPRFMGYQQVSNQIWINPANSTNWKLYPGQENVYGYDSVFPEWGSFDDHQGVYFHTQIGASQGHCPSRIGQD
ncbi:hypothetical protein MCUN1_000013 [Malassezia cuniculi]|uniref:Fungal lipase-type domain-containing protein n=1 Tax=Malassezia cuniculi TaxID=948313 RepID=A0AAF0EQE1_9BASI|nr:hypothetical protein MCUN1_000013 [Malassezia cuniculi]